MPTDGMFAACCDDQDFGTSCFPSSFATQYTPPRDRERVEKHTTNGIPESAFQ